MKPSYPTPPLPNILLRVTKCLCILVLLIMNFDTLDVELNLLGERLVLQGPCAFLADTPDPKLCANIASIKQCTTKRL